MQTAALGETFSNLFFLSSIDNICQDALPPRDSHTNVHRKDKHTNGMLPKQIHWFHPFICYLKNVYFKTKFNSFQNFLNIVLAQSLITKTQNLEVSNETNKKFNQIFTWKVFKCFTKTS